MLLLILFSFFLYFNGKTLQNGNLSGPTLYVCFRLVEKLYVVQALLKLNAVTKPQLKQLEFVNMSRYNKSLKA